MKALELEILKELNDLEYYNIKSPLNSKEFWREWQEKYNKANLMRIALRSILRRKKLKRKDFYRVKNMLLRYEDIIKYLESLKNLALTARGYYGYYIEFEEDDEDENYEGGP